MRPLVETAAYILSFIIDKLCTLLRIYKKIEPVEEPRQINCKKVGAIVFDHCENEQRNQTLKNGAKQDVDSLTSTMQALDFDVSQESVKGWKTIKDSTLTFLEKNAEECDCFVIVVLTEGMRDVNRYYDKITSLVNKVASAKNPVLVEKPKIVILQLRNDTVCVDSLVDDFSRSRETERQTSEWENQDEDDSGMPMFANFFILMSSFISSKVDSYNRKGSPLIAELVKQLEQHSDEDLYEIVMSVLKEMKDLPCHKRYPYYVSTLTQRVYFK